MADDIRLSSSDRMELVKIAAELFNQGLISKHLGMFVNQKMKQQDGITRHDVESAITFDEVFLMVHNTVVKAFKSSPDSGA